MATGPLPGPRGSVVVVVDVLVVVELVVVLDVELVDEEDVLLVELDDVLVVVLVVEVSVQLTSTCLT
jgi:hypothetical protein